MPSLSVDNQDAALVEIYEALERCQSLVQRSGLDPTECELQLSQLLLRAVQRTRLGQPIHAAVPWAICCVRRLLGRVRRSKHSVCAGLLLDQPAPDPEQESPGLLDLWQLLDESAALLERLLSSGELRCLWAARDAVSMREAADRAEFCPAQYRASFSRLLRRISQEKNAESCFGGTSLRVEAK